MICWLGLRMNENQYQTHHDVSLFLAKLGSTSDRLMYEGFELTPDSCMYEVGGDGTQ